LIALMDAWLNDKGIRARAYFRLSVGAVASNG